MIVLILLLVVLVALVVVENVMANTTTAVESPHNPGDAALIVERQFIAKANVIGRQGHSRTVRPRLKKDPPTLHVDISPSGRGALVRMHASFVAEKRHWLPWIPKHGLWIWRKQRTIAKALTASAAQYSTR